MKAERKIWIVLVVILSILLATINLRYIALQNAFLVKDMDSPYKAAAIKMFIEQEGATKDMISDSVYVSYLGFSDRVCIRFVPRAGVRGGATTYCFRKELPARLIGVDREAE